jgi:hypothetical protein
MFDSTPKIFQKKIINLVFSHKYERILLRIYRQSGKSWLFAYLACAFANTHPRSTVVIIAPTTAQGMDVYWRDQTKLFGMLSEEIKSKNEKNSQIVLMNGASIIIRGVDNLENRRGLTADLLLCDEVAWYPRHTYMGVLAPFTRVRNGITVFASTPLDMQGNEFYEIEHQIREGTWKDTGYALHMSLYDDPDLAQEDIKRIEVDYASNPNLFKREYLAEYGAMRGLLFPTFDQSLHVINYADFKFDPKKPIVAGMDWGFSPDPNAVLFGQQQGAFIYVFEEHVATGETIPTLYSKVEDLCSKHPWVRREGYGDASSPGNIATMNQSASLDGKPGWVTKSKSDTSGFDKINQSMLPLRTVTDKTTGARSLVPQLRITSNCGNLITSLANLQELDPRASRSEKTSNHAYSHTPDALKYMYNSGRFFIQNSRGEVASRAFFADRQASPMQQIYAATRQDPFAGYDPNTRIWD